MTHADSVRSFFEDPQVYLREAYVIRIRAHVVRDLLGVIPGARVADVGCGDGSLSLQFTEARSITLVDVASSMLAIARSGVPPSLQQRVAFVNTDVESWPPGESYDVILCLGLLAHVEDVRATVEALSRRIAPNGRIIFQITDTDRLLGRLTFRYQRWRNDRGHSVRHSLRATGAREIIEAARNEGLAHVTTRGYLIVPPGAGRLPGSVLHRWGRFVYRNGYLSRAVSDVVMLFERSG